MMRFWLFLLLLLPLVQGQQSDWNNDKTPPVTTFVVTESPSIISVSLNSTDDISGVKGIIYCTDNLDYCIPREVVPNGVTITYNKTNNPIFFVRFQAIDNAGNLEEVKSTGQIEPGKLPSQPLDTRPYFTVAGLVLIAVIVYFWFVIKKRSS